MAAAGCQTKTAATDGAGFVLETPAAVSRDFIAKHDRQFAEQVAGNRRACMRAPGCLK